MMKAKTIEDLTIKELFEDLESYLLETQYMAPPFCDEMFVILRKYINKLKENVEDK